MRILLIGLVVFTSAGAGIAQAQGMVYGIGGPAAFTAFGSSGSAMHLAGGGEVLAGGRAGGAAEVGMLGNSTGGLIVFSANGVLHLSTSRVGRGPSPFVTAGYTRMGNSDGPFSAWNVGGGVDVWNGRLGLRIEVRDHVRPDDRGAAQYWTIRAGVCLR